MDADRPIYGRAEVGLGVTATGMALRGFIGRNRGGAQRLSLKWDDLTAFCAGHSQSLSFVCKDFDMDEHQHRELRDWGERLAAASDAEQRAMGRAILMLLAQIEALQAELDAASSPATQHRPGAEHRRRSTPSTATEADPLDSDGLEQGCDLVEPLPDELGPVEDTTEIGLRERVRRAARQLRADNRH